MKLSVSEHVSYHCIRGPLLTMTVLPGEIYRLAYPSLPDLENPAYVSYGKPFDEACIHHVKNTFKATRAYIIASASLTKNTDEVKKLENALGECHAGTWPGLAPHTPWDEVADATNDARAKKADCLITIGGGSLVDGAKAMLLFLANDVTTIEGIRQFEKKCQAINVRGKQSTDIPVTAPHIPLICIPTTLSGGEYTIYAGGTWPDTHLKSIMGHPYAGPRLIINDPKLAITAPEWVWISTGVRAIDHCVEAYCQTAVNDEEMDHEAIEAFKLIVPNLLVTKKQWTNEDARLQCFLGVNKVVIMLKKHIMPGASHGIGHQLGPLGVGHGETSCILLPSVLKYNAKVNIDKQEQLKEAVWGEIPLADVLTKRGLRPETSDLADALDGIFRELGMPRTLKEKGIGRDKFQVLAMNSLKDPCAKYNPIPLEREEQVFEILEKCAGD
jgi:alcohol dehydrogenase class IV